MRKANANNKLDRLLTQEQRDQVKTWLVKENVGYAEAARRCREQFAVKVGTTALWRYYHREDALRVQEGIFKSAALANEVIEAAEASSGDPFRALLEMVTRAGLAQATGENPDWGTVKDLLEAAVSGRKQQTAEEAETRAGQELALKLRAYEDKVAAQRKAIEGECAKAKAEGLTAETVQRIEEMCRLL